MWLDIALIAIIVIFAIVGLAKGFIDSVLSIFSSVISLVAAYFLAKYVVSFLDNLVHINNFFSNMLGGWGIGEAGIAGFTREKMGALISFILCVIVIWLVIKLAIWLLSKLFSSVTANSSAISGINRVLGLLFGAAKGALIIAVCLAGTSVVVNMMNLTQVSDYIKSTTVTNYCYNYISDFTANHIQGYVNDLISKMTGKTEDTKTEGEESGASEHAIVIEDNNEQYIYYSDAE